jgi:peptidyl-tRNA hydrolase, PTH1 family
MHLIVGLGNPGKEYGNTRHNAGFMVLDLLAGGMDWEKKYDSEFLKTDDVILAKPQLFMNLSGKSVAQILKYYPDATLVVIHDELDLPVGSLKIVKNSSSAGHNGVQSIMDELGTQDFIRVRIGIDNPETKQGMPGDIFVLQQFRDQEQDIMKEVIVRVKQAVETLQTEGFEAAQNKFNG